MTSWDHINIFFLDFVVNYLIFIKIIYKIFLYVWKLSVWAILKKMHFKSPSIHPIGDTIQDLGKFLSSHYFLVQDTRFLSLVPESADNQNTVTCPCILFHIQFRDQGQKPVPSFWKKRDTNKPHLPKKFTF